MWLEPGPNTVSYTQLVLWVRGYVEMVGIYTWGHGEGGDVCAACNMHRKNDSVKKKRREKFFIKKKKKYLKKVYVCVCVFCICNKNVCISERFFCIFDLALPAEESLRIIV